MKLDWLIGPDNEILSGNGNFYIFSVRCRLLYTRNDTDRKATRRSFYSKSETIDPDFQLHPSSACFLRMSAGFCFPFSVVRC